MTYHVHQIDSNLHKEFLAEQRKDPVTKNFIKAGDRIVICAGRCKSAFLEDTWKLTLKETHCEQSNTLSTVPSSPTKRRFTSKKTPPRRFDITNLSTNGPSTGTPVSPNTQSTAPPRSTNTQFPRTFTPTYTQTTLRTVNTSNTNSNLVAPVLGGVFVVFLGFIFISLIGFGIISIAISQNDKAAVSSSNSFASNSTNRVSSSNSAPNRNNYLPVNTNRVSNVSPTLSPSPSLSSYSLSNCRLYNDKSYENKVFIRSDCDSYDCDMDETRIIGSLPDNTPINLIPGVSPIKSFVTNYSWIKVEIINTRQKVWVADSKIKCN